jgi:hypothetical protein
MTAHADPTLEALRVKRDTYVASGGQAAVSYDKLRDGFAVTKQRLSDQEKVLRAAKRGRPKTMAANGAPREVGEAAEAKL